MTTDPLSTVVAAAIGGLAGGVLGVVGTLLSSYYGPKKLEELRERRVEARNTPRKRLLTEMLQDKRYRSRTLRTLRIVTGTTEDECRRLLIEIGARGRIPKEGQESGPERWVLIENAPLTKISDDLIGDPDPEL